MNIKAFHDEAGSSTRVIVLARGPCLAKTSIYWHIKCNYIISFSNLVCFIIFCRSKSFLLQYIALFLVGLMWDSRGTHFLRGTHFSMTRYCVMGLWMLAASWMLRVPGWWKALFFISLNFPLTWNPHFWLLWDVCTSQGNIC